MSASSWANVNRFDCTISRPASPWFATTEFMTVRSPRGIEGSAVAYVRPHDISIYTTKAQLGLPAIVRHIAAAGPVAVVELAAEGVNGPVEALLSRTRHRELKLAVGQSVFLRAQAARIYPAEPAAAIEARRMDRWPPER
jgi:sulfate transport system ATP-binding protein